MQRFSIDKQSAASAADSECQGNLVPNVLDVAFVDMKSVRWILVVEKEVNWTAQRRQS